MVWWGATVGGQLGSGRGAIAGCYCHVLRLQGGMGDGQVWGSGRGAIAGCLH